MPSMPGKRLPYVFEKLGLGPKAAAKWVGKNGNRSEKYAESAYNIVRKNGGKVNTAYGDVMDKTTEMAVRGRQRQVGARYAAGGLGLGSMGMYNNISGRRSGTSPMTGHRPSSGRNP